MSKPKYCSRCRQRSDTVRACCYCGLKVCAERCGTKAEERATGTPEGSPWPARGWVYLYRCEPADETVRGKVTYETRSGTFVLAKRQPSARTLALWQEGEDDLRWESENGPP